MLHDFFVKFLCASIGLMTLSLGGVDDSGQNYDTVGERKMKKTMDLKYRFIEVIKSLEGDDAFSQILSPNLIFLKVFVEKTV